MKKENKVVHFAKKHGKIIAIAAGAILGGMAVYGAYRMGRASYRKDFFNQVFGEDSEESRYILGMIKEAGTCLYIHASNDDVQTVKNSGKLLQQMMDSESCKGCDDKTARSILVLCDD